MYSFKLLGNLEVFDGREIYTPTAPKACRVLALLLLRANYVVSTHTLIEELWGERPPRRAITTVQTYIYQLRKFLADGESADGAEAEMLETRPPGYVLHLDHDQLDVSRFERLVAAGQAEAENGRPEHAVPALREALDLWRGPALADVGHGSLLEAHAVHLEEMRLGALEARVQAEMQLGRHRALIPELKWLTSSYPLNEWFHGQLIEALNRSGRRSDALDAYQSLRHVLNEELGLDPAPELQRLQQEMLNIGYSSTTPSSTPSSTPSRTGRAHRRRPVRQASGGGFRRWGVEQLDHGR